MKRTLASGGKGLLSKSAGTTSASNGVAKVAIVPKDDEDKVDDETMKEMMI